MAKLERGIGVMILSLIVFMSPAMLSFGNIAHLSSSLFRASLSSSSVLDIFLDEAHIPPVVAPNPLVAAPNPPIVAPNPPVAALDHPLVAPDSPIDFSVQPLDILDPFPSSPFNEQVEDEQVEDKLPNPNPKHGSPALAPPEDLAQDIPPRHLTQVRSIPAHLLDYHCHTALATLHEPRIYLEASIDPLW